MGGSKSEKFKDVDFENMLDIYERAIGSGKDGSYFNIFMEKFSKIIDSDYYKNASMEDRIFFINILKDDYTGSESPLELDWLIMMWLERNYPSFNKIQSTNIEIENLLHLNNNVRLGNNNHKMKKHTEEEVFNKINNLKNISNKIIFNNKLNELNGYPIEKYSDENNYYEILNKSIKLGSSDAVIYLLEQKDKSSFNFKIMDVIKNSIINSNSNPLDKTAYLEIFKFTNKKFFYESTRDIPELLSLSIKHEAFWFLDLVIKCKINVNKMPNSSNVLFTIMDTLECVEKNPTELNTHMNETLLMYFENFINLINLTQDDSFTLSVLLMNISTCYYYFEDINNILKKVNIVPEMMVNRHNEKLIELKFIEKTGISKLIFLKTYTEQLKNYKYSVNDNNIFHLILEEINFEHIAPFLAKNIELGSLLFEVNKYGKTPIEKIVEKKDKVELSFFIYMLELITTNEEHQLIIKKLKEDNKELIDNIKFTLNVECLNKIEGVITYKYEIIAALNELVLIYKDQAIEDITEFLDQSNEKSFEHANTYETYTVYSEDDVETFNKHIKEFSLDAIVNWGKKLKEQSGIKKIANNRNLKSNIAKLRETFPNFHEFLDHVENSIYLNDMGDGQFNIPPSLLVSTPGIGKTFFLDSLAKAVGVNYDMISMEAVSAGFVLVGLTSQYKDSAPGLIFKSVFESEYANNILILDEIDKVTKGNFPVGNVLLPLLEEHTSKRFKDEHVPIPMDISKLVWVATANDLTKISAPILSRYQVFNIPSPNYRERMVLADAIYKTLIEKNKWGTKFEISLSDEVKQVICEDWNSSRDLRKVILKSCGRAAKRGDNKIILEDLDLKNINKTIDPWDQKIEKE